MVCRLGHWTKNKNKNNELDEQEKKKKKSPASATDIRQFYPIPATFMTSVTE